MDRAGTGTGIHTLLIGTRQVVGAIHVSGALWFAQFVRIAEVALQTFARS